MNFCSQCGSRRMEWVVPAGDNRPRHVCADCRTVFYQNPKIVAGCLPEWGDRLLLCRRAIEPRYGLWTLPAGFMELAETTEQAAARETLEEACARVRVGMLYAIYNLPHVGQVYMLYRGELADPEYAAGDESLEVALFSEERIPWGELAFPTIHETLRHYFADRREGVFRLHTGTIAPRAQYPPSAP